MLDISRINIIDSKQQSGAQSKYGQNNNINLHSTIQSRNNTIFYFESRYQNS